MRDLHSGDMHQPLLPLLLLLLSLNLAAGQAVSVPLPGIAASQPSELPDISRLSLERTRCYTACPAYRAVIHADGRIDYTGVHAVARLGKHSGTVEVGLLRQLFRYIDETDFRALEPSYSSPFLDNATAITTVVLNGRRKTVMNYANSGPATLWALEWLIDDLIGTTVWGKEKERAE